jgi:hypothetical protein
MMTESACRNCRRPIFFVEGIGWLHGELPQYAHQPITCEFAHPVECKHRIDAPCPLTPPR